MLWLNLKHTFHKCETHQVNFEGASLTKKMAGRVRQLIPVNFTLLYFLCMFSLIRITCCLDHSSLSLCSNHDGNSSLSQDCAKRQEEEILSFILSIYLSYHNTLLQGKKIYQNKPKQTLWPWTTKVFRARITWSESRARQMPPRGEHHEVLSGPTKS